MTSTAVEVPRFTRVFHGRTDQVRQARLEVARYLSASGCPVTDDVTLVVSEFATNAVIHSASRDQFFTVRAELFPACVRVEVEDLGGPWEPRPRDLGRPHGLDIVGVLAGPGHWGVEGGETGRVAWCRLDLAARP
jgi:anti-sigma regulatory factor (Ser/Thr protein kinase)